MQENRPVVFSFYDVVYSLVLTIDTADFLLPFNAFLAIFRFRSGAYSSASSKYNYLH
jgi:hypothetical protein